ncbi:MAG: methyltransferase domain-containing protein [Pseudomonadota bacterium]
MRTIALERLNLPPGVRVLDIGCGSGRHTAAAYELPGCRAVGVDINPEDLEAARGRLRFHDSVGVHGGGLWALAAADSLALPFADGAFDLVICSEVLEHIADHRRALTEAVRVLTPGGLLAVSVPRFWPEALCWRLSATYAGTAGGHIRIYTHRKLLLLLGETGVTPFARHWAHALHSPYWWLKCLVGPHRENCAPVKLYHRLLTWDMMKKPAITRWTERLLNPVMGKSLVVYGRKPAQ